MAYTVAMDWREYEGEIEAQFRQAYPSAQITHDAKLIGKFSKVERQIDLLIEEHASDSAVRIGSMRNTAEEKSMSAMWKLS